MKTRRVFVILSILFLVSAVMFTAHPVAANTSQHYSYDTENTWTWFGTNNPCGFDIQVHDYGILRWTNLFDNNGQFIKEIFIAGNLKEDWSANGKTVNVQMQGPVLVNVEYYPDKIIEYDKYVGTIAMITIPHQGHIHGGGGQMIDTITYTPDGTFVSETLDTIAGNLNFDDGPVCAYLSP